MQHTQSYKGGTITAGGAVFLQIEPKGGQPLQLAAPSFGQSTGSATPFVLQAVSEPRTLRNGGEERSLRYTAGELTLWVELRTFVHSPALRFRYRLQSAPSVTLQNNAEGKNQLTYLSLQFPVAPQVTELQFAQFNPMIHSYQPVERECPALDLSFGMRAEGPMLLLEDAQTSVLLGYEHGATYGEGYLNYHLQSDASGLQLCLQAVKGNYYHGQPANGYTTPWQHIIALPGGSPRQALQSATRSFFMQDINEHSAARRPYLFYNSWNFQERDHDFDGKPYLIGMNLERMLQEVEVAHDIGIEVFVIDTGWFSKTGDWAVNLERFPDGMRELSAKLKGYGMQLGLWFDPTKAAVSSQIVQEHPEYRSTMGGQVGAPQMVWETEHSHNMCLCSPYWQSFAQTLIRLNKELGVTYFKWDGIGQRMCDSPAHDHGTAQNTESERLDCYGFAMGLRMIDIAQALSEACPEAIVDFDVTESGRFVGTGFLAAGKYFLVNNGPYWHDFDLPQEHVQSCSWNLFFYPGAARPRFCRSGVAYDSIVPSGLFLTHYLPDGSEAARQNSYAALVLGGNGIWGNLRDLTPEERAFWREHLAAYKTVREPAAASPAQVQGSKGCSPEIIAKYNDQGGLLAFFTHEWGRFSKIIQLPADAELVATGADEVEELGNGCYRITVQLGSRDARVVLLSLNKS